MFSRSYVAVTEAFSLASHGSTPETAVRNLFTVVDEFLHGALIAGDLRKVLRKYGWKKVASSHPHGEAWEFQWYDRNNISRRAR
jgi:hypothetical protein